MSKFESMKEEGKHLKLWTLTNRVETCQIKSQKDGHKSTYPQEMTARADGQYAPVCDNSPQIMNRNVRKKN